MWHPVLKEGRRDGGRVTHLRERNWWAFCCQDSVWPPGWPLASAPVRKETERKRENEKEQWEIDRNREEGSDITVGSELHALPPLTFPLPLSSSSSLSVLSCLGSEIQYFRLRAGGSIALHSLGLNWSSLQEGRGRAGRGPQGEAPRERPSQNMENCSCISPPIQGSLMEETPTPRTHQLSLT